MSSDSQPAIRDLSGWIDAEREGRLDEAEAAFARVVAACSEPLAPPVSFAEAVVARASFAGRRQALWFGLPVRVLTGVALVLMGLLIALLTGVSVFDLLAGPGVGLASVLARLMAVAGGAASVAAASWSVAAAVADAVLKACSTGVAPFLFLLNVLLAIAGSLGLRRLLAPPKECW